MADTRPASAAICEAYDTLRALPQRSDKPTPRPVSVVALVAACGTAGEAVALVAGPFEGAEEGYGGGWGSGAYLGSKPN